MARLGDQDRRSVANANPDSDKSSKLLVVLFQPAKNKSWEVKIWGRVVFFAIIRYILLVLPVIGFLSALQF